jgi:hypothetical protein
MIAALVAIVALPTAAAEAQGRGQGWGRDQQAVRHFDPATVVTVTGTVNEVLSESGTAGSAGTHLVLDVDGESMEADIGPPALSS